MLLWLWLVNFAIALPAALVVADSLSVAIGSSQVHEKLRSGFDMEWFEEFESSAGGLAGTFSPTVTGAGAFYGNLEAWLSGGVFTLAPELLAIGGIYVLVWALMLGGVLDRMARPADRPSAGRFFRSGGRYFFRFVRLAAFSAPLYIGVYLFARRSFDWIENVTRDVPGEVMLVTFGVPVWALTVLLLLLIHVSFNYAKIATVVEDRRSMLLSAVRGIGFTMRHPVKTLGLYAGLLLISGIGLAAYALVAPGAGQTTQRAVLWAFGAGQLFLLFKLLMRLSLYAGQTALYQGLTREKPALPEGALDGHRRRVAQSAARETHTFRGIEA